MHISLNCYTLFGWLKYYKEFTLFVYVLAYYNNTLLFHKKFKVQSKLRQFISIF